MSPDGNGWDWASGTTRLLSAWIFITAAVSAALAVVLVAIALGSRR